MDWFEQYEVWRKYNIGLDYLLHGAVQAAYVVVQQLEADVGDILNGDKIQAGLTYFVCKVKQTPHWNGRL